MPFSFRLDKETAARIRRLATATGRTKSEVVREAVARYTPDKQPPDEAGPSAFDRLRVHVGIITTDGAQCSQKDPREVPVCAPAKHRARRPR